MKIPDSKITNAGGAISVGANTGQTALTIHRSSFVSNIATAGGAINLAGGNANQMYLDNSTFYDNRSSSNGAAILLNSGADAAIHYVTILQNVSQNYGGGIRVENTGSILTLKNSLVIDNQGVGSEGPNISITGSHTYTDGGYNLIGYNGVSGLKTGGTVNATPAGTSAVAAATAVDEIIVPALTDYSGLHHSIALTKNSVARDKIPNGYDGGTPSDTTDDCVTDQGYDERGFDRPDMVDVTDPDQNGDIRDCDIGAFEFNNAYRVDCFDEDGLRPDQGSGYGYYYCPDGTNPSPGELANNVFVGRIDQLMLMLMAMIGVWRRIMSSRRRVG